MSKEERISAKQAELMETLSDADAGKMKIVSDLVRQAAFMSVTLEDLAEVISEEGVTEEYFNGQTQSGRKISSNAKMYASLISKYDTIISNLLKLVPASKEKKQTQPMSPRASSSSSELIERQKAKEAAFFEALREGTVLQSDYHDFCKEWERQHAV